MKLILLAGNSIKNKEWIEGIKSALEEFFDSTEIQYYNHWSTGAPFISYPNELNALKKIAKGNYVIFAKSAGVVLTLMAFDEGWLKPEKCVFAGVPYGAPKRSGAEQFRKLLNKFSVPTLIIQETNDPYGGFAVIKKLIHSSNYQFAEVPGDKHRYADIAKLKKLVLGFISL